MAYIIDKTYFVVFNPTEEDFNKSNETEEEAQKDLARIRYWLSKKEGEESYNYKGTGNYPSGPISSIGAIEMYPEKLSILSLSPRYNNPDFEGVKISGEFTASELNFRDCFLNTLSFCLLQNDAAPVKVNSAYVALSSVMVSINNLDFDNAYLNLEVVNTPSGSLTEDIKANMVQMLKQYLEKYPR